MQNANARFVVQTYSTSHQVQGIDDVESALRLAVASERVL
jgi:hypothetical protein